MAQYGENMDNDFTIEHIKIYNLISSYFDNPQMTKIKDVNNYSMYLAKIYCLMCVEHRYLIAFITKDYNPVGTTTSLSELHWVSFQTRSMTDNHNIKSITYTPKREAPYDSQIIIKLREKTYCDYICPEFPRLAVCLLLKKGQSMYEYQNRGTLSAALETFSTSLTISNR